MERTSEMRAEAKREAVLKNGDIGAGRKRKGIPLLALQGRRNRSGEVRKLLEYAGSFEEIYNMKKQVLETLPFLRGQDAEHIQEAKALFEKRCREYRELRKNGIRFIMAGEPEYPRRLENIYDMPMWLFVKGDLPKEHLPTAAVIGARSCTPYGRQVAEYIGRILAENGIQTVSGLASGIDGAGHRGAVKAQGASYAVLGSGVDNCYPRENLSLYNAILETGGVISNMGRGEAGGPQFSFEKPDYQRAFRCGNCNRSEETQRFPDNSGYGSGAGERGLCRSRTC